MLGQWRIVLRQAEESARAGRLDEALALASRPDVADHRQAVALRGRLTQELIGRAGRRSRADDIAGAIDDLALAERHGATPDALAAARLSLGERVAEELRVELEAGEPGRILDRIDHLARQHVSSPLLRRIREGADCWQKAHADLRRGEYGQAREGLERAERLLGDTAAAALKAARRDLETRQQQSIPRVERLYEALAQSRWSETLSAAEQVLEILPDHPAARQARARAWQEIGGLSPAEALPRRSGIGGADPIVLARFEIPPRASSAAPGGLDADRTRQAPPREEPRRLPAAWRTRNPGPSGRFLLWVDAVGGYLMCLDDEVVLGRSAPDGTADVQVLGDLARRHATVVRSGDGYVIQAHHATYVNGRKVVDAAPLRHGDVVRLGGSVELEFRQPSPISSTARLELVSRHRLPLAVDGVILMAETCIIGPGRQAHIPAPNTGSDIVVYRQGPALWCRAPGEFEVDGQFAQGRTALTLSSSVLGQGYSFSLEPLTPARSTQV